MGGKFRMKPDSQGRYKPTLTGLYNILTNPVYIGWWKTRTGGIVKDNHEPIVDEGLFVYTHKHVSRFTIDGERQKPAKVVRFGKADALLRKVAVGSNGSVYVRPKEQGAYYTSPVIVSQTRMSYRLDFSIAVCKIDEVFLEKFFERARTLKIDDSWKDRGGNKKREREKKMKMIEKGINDTQLKMQRITLLLTDIDHPVPPSMKTDLLTTYQGLEKKKQRLEAEKLACMEYQTNDEETLYEARTIIPTILKYWPRFSFEQRMKFVGALIQQVVFHRVSPSWIELQIEWKEITQWDFLDIAHIRLTDGGGKQWTPEEDELLRMLYPEHPLEALLHALPTRTWTAMQGRASTLGILRTYGATPLRPKDIHDRTLALRDYEYMATIDLSKDKIAHWSRPSLRAIWIDQDISTFADGGSQRKLG